MRIRDGKNVDPGWKKCGSRIRDAGWEKVGSGINIPYPPRKKQENFLISLPGMVEHVAGHVEGSGVAVV